MTDPFDRHMQLMQEAVLALLSRGIERTARFPQNGYRRRIYFEGMALLGEDLTLLARAAAALVRTSGADLQQRAEPSN